MLAEITLIPYKTYRKDDLRGRGTTQLATYKENRFDFQEDINKAGEVELKLFKLLTALEQHQAELERLTVLGCEMYITFYWESYIGNTMLGGFFLNKDIIAKLNKLNVEIDFDLYTGGTSFN